MPSASPPVFWDVRHARPRPVGRQESREGCSAPHVPLVRLVDALDELRVDLGGADRPELDTDAAVRLVSDVRGQVDAALGAANGPGAALFPDDANALIQESVAGRGPRALEDGRRDHGHRGRARGVHAWRHLVDGAAGDQARDDPEGEPASNGRHRALVMAVVFCHVRSGLYVFIASAIWGVFGPRSFWYTTPSWLTMNVMIPETPYLAGKATSANPPIMCPLTTKS